MTRAGLDEREIASDIAFPPQRQGHPVPPGVPYRLCPHGKLWRLGDDDYARSRRFHRSADEHLLRYRQSLRAALHPGSWWSAGFSACARRENYRLRQFSRRPAVHHRRQPSREPTAHLFLMDYSTRQRLKLWGAASVVEDDNRLVARLMPPACKAKGPTGNPLPGRYLGCPVPAAHFCAFRCGGCG